MRLEEFICSQTQYSRRQCLGLLDQGRLFVNRKKATQLSMEIDPVLDQGYMGVMFLEHFKGTIPGMIINNDDFVTQIAQGGWNRIETFF